MKNAILAQFAAATGGQVMVRNGGNFVAVIRLRYQLKNKRFARESRTFAAGESQTLFWPESATEVELTILLPVQPGQFVELTSISLDDCEQTCLKLSGHMLNPHFEEIIC